MAILQSRMIALINAAIDYQNGFRQTQQLIHDANERVQQASPLEIEEVAKTEMLNLVLRTNDLNVLEDSARSQATITGEHYRYTVNKKRNELNRKYMEQRRGGITQKHHIEPDYATEEFNTTAMRKIPFRAERQNQKGFTPINYTPAELSAHRKAQINRQIEIDSQAERSPDPNTDIIPKGKDPFLESLNKQVDIDFNKRKIEPRDEEQSE